MKRLAAAMVVGAVGLMGAQAAGAGPILEGYGQVWWTAHEAVENGLQQAGSGDRAAQAASGFSLRRVRLSIGDTLGSARLRYEVELLLEKSARLTDCYVAGQVAEGVELRVGQMKIPSTYEAMAPAAELDFAQPSTISGLIADWSLSRTPYIATFMGNRGYLRDVGAALQVQHRSLRALAMVSNGLGANLFVAGGQRKEFIKANGAGDMLYGLRLDAAVSDGVQVGGHALLNRHEDMLFNDEKTVIDLERRSWSADLRATGLPAGLRLTALYAGGVVDDDYYRDDKSNYEYGGYELKALRWIRPGALEAGVRLDRYEYEYSESGSTVTETAWTTGANWYLFGHLKVQTNYTWRATDEAYVPDLDDDVLLVNVQFSF